MVDFVVAVSNEHFSEMNGVKVDVKVLIKPIQDFGYLKREL